MTQDREGLRSLVFANPTGIFSKGHIEDPMEGVLNAPVLSHCLSKPPALRRERGQKIPRVDLDGGSYFTTRFDHAHAVQVGPGGLCSKPFNLRRNPISPCFNAAVIAIDGFVVGVLKISKACAPGIVEK